MTASLTKVKRAASKAALARQALEAAIREAREQGASLRAIAKAADMSYETVRKLDSRRDT